MPLEVRAVARSVHTHSSLLLHQSGAVIEPDFQGGLYVGLAEGCFAHSALAGISRGFRTVDDKAVLPHALRCGQQAAREAESEERERMQRAGLDAREAWWNATQVVLAHIQADSLTCLWLGQAWMRVIRNGAPVAAITGPTRGGSHINSASGGLEVMHRLSVGDRVVLCTWKLGEKLGREIPFPPPESMSLEEEASTLISVESEAALVVARCETVEWSPLEWSLRQEIRLGPDGPVVRRLAARRLPREIAEKRAAIPLRYEGTRLVVAMEDPADAKALEEIRLMTGCEVDPIAAPRVAILSALEQVYPPRPVAK